MLSLESEKLTKQLDPQVWKHVCERLDNLETLDAKVDTMWANCITTKTVDTMFEHFGKIIAILQTKTEEIEDEMKAGRKPHKCPVCDGCGNDKGTTESNPNFEFCMKYASCNACEGKGIVWG